MRNLLFTIASILLLAITNVCGQEPINNITKLENQVQNESNSSFNTAITIKYKLQNITQKLNLIDEKTVQLKFKLKGATLNQEKKIFAFRANTTLIRKKESNIKAHIVTLKNTVIKLKKLMNQTQIYTEVTSYYHRLDKIIDKISNLKEERLQLKSQEKILKTKIFIAHNKGQINRLRFKSQLNRLKLRKAYLTRIKKNLEIKQEKNQNN